MEDRVTQARILIVDDEPDDIRGLRRILEAEGYTDVVGTHHPEEVGQLTEEIDPDLILLDMIMPRMTGQDGLASA